MYNYSFFKRKNRHVFLIVLEAGGPRPRRLLTQCLVRACLQVRKHAFSHCVLTWQEGQESPLQSVSLFLRFLLNLLE